MRLRSPTNQPLELATLFINSKHEEEALPELIEPEVMSYHDGLSAKRRSVFAKVKDMPELNRDMKEVIMYSSAVEWKKFT